MLNKIIEDTNNFIRKMKKNDRKTYGQFFTSKATAEFMAKLFSLPKKQNISILDPGAGTGILSIALILRIIHEKKYYKNIYLVCYENDPLVLFLLKDNLIFIKKYINEIDNEINFSYEIREENYILTQKPDYLNSSLLQSKINNFDLIITNPPYKKISKNAPEALVMKDICYGAPNLYFLFIAMNLFNLKEKGELVCIIPRSWTSGAYFRKFRERIFLLSVIEHIHLFISRTKVFDEEDVLQETMILKLIKTTNKPHFIEITTTNSNADFVNITSYKALYGSIVSSINYYVYLITNKNDENTLLLINKFDKCLLDIGLKMRTGLTVDFRNRDSLQDDFCSDSLPVFYSQHLKNGRISFPKKIGNEYIKTDKEGLKQPNYNYLFVKRFTSKEEHRRLQCAIYLCTDFPMFKEISTQNKINFITAINRGSNTSPLSVDCVFGLYVLFNSTIYDNYYRILNGSTQVNSTEFNTIPVPSLQIIKQMGKHLQQCNDLTETTCNKIIMEYL